MDKILNVSADLLKTVEVNEMNKCERVLEAKVPCTI